MYKKLSYGKTAFYKKKIRLIYKRSAVDTDWRMENDVLFFRNFAHETKSAF